MNQPIFQPILIQEVSYTGSIGDGEADPKYKDDNFVNLSLFERIRPTKRKEVVAVTVAGKVSYVFRDDIKHYFPEHAVAV